MEFPGVATGDVTVSIFNVRADATTGPFVATTSEPGLYSYALTSTLVADVNELQLTFTGTVAGAEYTIVEIVEVAGKFYFEVNEARTEGPIEASFSDADIERMRHAVEDQIEANCDTSFVSRFVVESASGREEFIRLTENYVLELVSVVEEGTNITSEVVLDGRYVWRSSTGGLWPSGHRNIRVMYEAAFQKYPPGDLRRKAIEATRYGLLRERRQGLPPQAVTLGTEAGTLRLAVAGLKQPFGLPEVDAVVLKWAKRVGVPVAGT